MSMKQKPLRQPVTLFVCTRDRGKKSDSCGHFGAEKVLSQLKRRIKERKLGDLVRLHPTGCIDKCSKGPNILGYPSNCLFFRVEPHDVDALLDQMLDDAGIEHD